MWQLFYYRANTLEKGGFFSSGETKKPSTGSEFILWLLHSKMEHNSVPIHLIWNSIGVPDPAWNSPDFLLKPEPETGSGKTGNPDFSKVVELITSFLYVPLTPNWVLGGTGWNQRNSAGLNSNVSALLKIQICVFSLKVLSFQKYIFSNIYYLYFRPRYNYKLLRN